MNQRQMNFRDLYQVNIYLELIVFKQKIYIILINLRIKNNLPLRLKHHRKHTNRIKDIRIILFMNVNKVIK